MKKKGNGYGPTDKPGEAKFKVVPTENIRKKQLFTFRRVVDNKISPAARTLARACAEDANTAFYVREYDFGNFDARADYIEYMADKFQFLMNGGKL